MAGSTPEEAVDAFLERIGTTLDCLADCSVHRSPLDPADQSYGLTAFERGSGALNLLSLITHEGTGEVRLRFSHKYCIVEMPEDQDRGPFKVRTLAYHYRILDVEDNEIALYHWHPVNSGPVITPHLHVPAAVPVQMCQGFASSRKDEKTYLGNMHFPTARIFLEDIVELLVRDFAVFPNREDDWQAIVQDNREAIQRGRTW